jgi:hypothetical protein
LVVPHFECAPAFWQNETTELASQHPALARTHAAMRIAATA